jgi:hypothetical protein
MPKKIPFLGSFSAFFIIFLDFGQYFFSFGKKNLAEIEKKRIFAFEIINHSFCH